MVCLVADADAHDGEGNYHKGDYQLYYRVGLQLTDDAAVLVIQGVIAVDVDGVVVFLHLLYFGEQYFHQGVFGGVDVDVDVGVLPVDVGFEDGGDGAVFLYYGIYNGADFAVEVHFFDFADRLSPQRNVLLLLLFEKVGEVVAV